MLMVDIFWFLVAVEKFFLYAVVKISFALYLGETGGPQAFDGFVWRRCHALHPLGCPVSSTVLLPQPCGDLEIESF